MPSNHLILCHPLLLLPSIFPSIRVFSNESAPRIRWPNYWSFSFNVSLSNKHPGLISFRMDWLDLLAVQGTLKSLLQHHSSKASIPWHSAFFIVQLSHPYMTTGKTLKWSCLIVSNSLRPHELQHARPPCPSPTSGVHPTMSIVSVMPSNHLILCHPLLLLPSIFPSIRVFSNDSTLCMRWPKYWSFSFSIIPSKQHPGPISLEWTGWISLWYNGISRVFSNTTVQKNQFLGTQLSL